MTDSSRARSSVKKLLLAVWRSWASRSLAVGSVAMVIDIVVGVSCLHLLSMTTRTGAMLGVAIGGAFTFFANRYFAFREHNPQLAKPALKFFVATAVSMVVHGQIVVFLRDGWEIPFVAAKLMADVGVFTFGQLLLLRFVVFPTAKSAPERLEPVPVQAELRSVAEP